MRTYTPQKHKLSDLIGRFEAVADRLEAVAAKMEELSPPAPPPPDAAALEAANRYIETRKHELMGEDAPYE